MVNNETKLLYELVESMKRNMASYGHTRPSWCQQSEACKFCYSQGYTNGEYCWGVLVDRTKVKTSSVVPDCDVIVFCKNMDNTPIINIEYCTPIESLELVRGFSNVLRGYMKHMDWGDSE